MGRWSALGPALRPAEGLGAHCRPWALAPQTPGPRPARIPRGASGTSIPLAPAQWQQAPAALLTSAGPAPAHLGGASTPPNPTLPALPGVLTVPGPGRRSAHHALAAASSSLPLHSSTLGPAPAVERRPPVLTYSLQWLRLAGWSGPPTEVTAAGTRGGCGAGRTGGARNWAPAAAGGREGAGDWRSEGRGPERGPGWRRLSIPRWPSRGAHRPRNRPKAPSRLPLTNPSATPQMGQPRRRWEADAERGRPLPRPRGDSIPNCLALWALACGA